MHPLLFKLGPLEIHTYGFLIAVGFLIGVSVIKRLSMVAKIDVEKMLDLCFWMLLVGFLGGRILYILTRLSDFIASPLDMFKIWQGGLVFLGGLISVIPLAIWYAKKHKMPVWRVGDIIAPGAVIAHAFGRLGCLSAGCCYGLPTDAPWGIRLYSDLVTPNFQGIPLHPTQLYESFSLFILFVVLIRVFKKRAFDGQVTLTYWLSYSVIRSIIEVFRGDSIRGFVIEGWVSTSQFVSAFVFMASLGILIYKIKKAEATGPHSSGKHSKKKKG